MLFALKDGKCIIEDYNGFTISEYNEVLSLTVVLEDKMEILFWIEKQTKQTHEMCKKIKFCSETCVWQKHSVFMFIRY